MPIEITLPDGRTLRGYDAGPECGDLPVIWQHGTPGLGELPEPLRDVATELGIRWIGYDRPGYGTSGPNEGRDVAAAADDVAHLADALGIDRFATLGASGGATHALGCAAVLGDRVIATVAIAALAPFEADGLDWFAGMYPGGEAELRAAADGRDVLSRYLSLTDFDPAMFTPADLHALQGEWGWLGSVAGRAFEAARSNSPQGMVDDDLAFVHAWGCSPDRIRTPVLIVHGGDDRVVPPAHGAWLAAHIPDAQLRTAEGAGHLAVMHHAAEACRWLRAS